MKHDTKPEPVSWIDNTGTDVSAMFHAAIAEAIRNGGTLPEELADLFTLTRTPAGSAHPWRLDLK